MSDTPAVLERASDGTLLFWCPGCASHHGVRTEGSPSWTMTGTMEAPSFAPSVRVFDGDGTVCHFFIIGGRLHYLGDCRHSLAGQTVPMQPVDLAAPSGG